MRAYINKCTIYFAINSKCTSFHLKEEWMLCIISCQYLSMPRSCPFFKIIIIIYNNFVHIFNLIYG